MARVFSFGLVILGFNIRIWTLSTLIFFVRSFLTPINRRATNLIGPTTAKTPKRYTSFKGSRGHLWTQTLLRSEESHLGP